MKCEDQKPCNRCQKRNIACHVVPKALDGGPIDVTPHKESDLGVNDVSRISAADNEPLLPQPLAADNEPLLPHPLAPDFPDDDSFGSPSTARALHEFAQTGQQSETVAPVPGSVAMEKPSTMFPEMNNFRFLDSMDLFNDNFQPQSSGTKTPRGLINFGLETDLAFSDIDLGFLASYNARVPFESETHVENDTMPGVDPVSDNLGGQTSQDAASTLQDSIWRFVPDRQDHGYAEHPNLSLPATENTEGGHERRVEFDRRATTEKLDLASRDQIIAIVLSQVTPHMPRSPFSRFPNVDLLDSLLQYFLRASFSGASTWFHAASFSPKACRPELLTVMAAAGAVLTPDIALRKLGFAIQEVVRIHLPTIFESDNTEIRHLELSQAYMITLEIGLWSGNSRKIEIAESFQQPLLTMLRRGGKFRRSAYPTIALLAKDNGQALEKKWSEWIYQESFKRLVFHLLQHDAQSSMALLVSPLMSYAETCLPLPESQALWTAGTAKDWKALYLAKANTAPNRVPSLADCINDLELLESSRHLTDIRASCSAFLHAMWGMVWEYRQLTSLLRGKPRLWDSGLVLNSRYQELMKMLEYFRIGYTHECTLLLEMILMHMQFSLDDVQLFAGLEGPDEASRVYSSMREWTESRASRQAVWHAGQVVRAARSLPPHHLRDFNAIALYHASLAFWAYGLACRKAESAQPFESTPNRSSSHEVQGKQVVWLDGKETAEIQKYIAFERGSPGLHGAGADLSFALLRDPSAVMEVVIGSMRQNHDGLSSPRSPLVENLIHLMEGLRDTVN